MIELIKWIAVILFICLVLGLALRNMQSRDD